MTLRLFFCLLGLLGSRMAALSLEISPLQVVKDPLGEELQRTFISAPPDAAAMKVDAGFIAYRKTFSLASAPRAAALHLFADVRYLLWINGLPVHRGPNRFEIRGPQYDTVEIASALRAGSNTVAIVVMGNGSNARMMRHPSGLTLRLEADGRIALQTDATWKWSDQTRYRPAKVDWASILDRIDARVEDGDWTQPDYDDRAWKNAVKISGDTWGPLTRRRIPLLRDTPLVPKLESGAFPVALAAGEQLRFSMGRLVQAYTVLEIEADEGSELALPYAKIDYTARAGRQTYISSDSFAFDGGAISVKKGRATILGLKLVERLYPFDVVGSFTSSDATLNRLWAVCARSCQLFSEDSYVDCADRERAEWMDNDPPAFDITRTAMVRPGLEGKPLDSDPRLLEEMLRRTALTLQPDGWVKAHTTSDRFDVHARMEDRACDWVQGTRRYYDSTGNPAVIREIWPVMVRQMRYFLDRRTPRGLVLAREWIVWGNPVGYVTCEGARLNAFIYRALVDAAYLGNAIGEKTEAAHFTRAAADLAKAFNAVLWDEKNGTYFSGYYATADQAKADKVAREMKLKVENQLIEPTMFSALWALDRDLVPEARKARVTDYLLTKRTTPDRVMAFYYLFHQLYRQDTPELDREVIQTLRTRWKGMAESRWQASWEDLDRNWSKAHIYGMFPGYFLSAYVLGVRPDLPVANRRIIIEPRLGDLTSAEGSVITEFGPVPVSWKVEGDTLRFRVTVPPGVTALLRVPARGEKSRLAFTGKEAPSTVQGRYFAATIAGSHEGVVFPQ